jgi:hypothetical protein
MNESIYKLLQHRYRLKLQHIDLDEVPVVIRRFRIPSLLPLDDPAPAPAFVDFLPVPSLFLPGDAHQGGRIRLPAVST